MKQAIILAAGISSRMRSLTNNVPKPMLSLNGKPIMEYVIRHLRQAGFTDIIVTVHYLPTTIMDYFYDGSKFGLNIVYSQEKILRDTAGSLKLLEDKLQDEFLVCGGHFFLPDLNLIDMVSFHRENGGLATIAFKPMMEKNLLSFFGQGLFNGSQRLIKFKEKPSNILSSFIHTTYQIYSKKVVALIPAEMPVSIPDFLIPKLLEKKLPIYGYFTNSELINFSTMELYERALVVSKQMAFSR
mgnify:CR=1 FL=1